MQERRWWFLGALLSTGLVLAGRSATAGDYPAPAELLEPAGCKVYFVDLARGKKKNAGTKEAPYKDIGDALDNLGKKDACHVILVAAGVYTNYKKGYYDLKLPRTKLYGGFSSDFTKRDPHEHLTVIQPTRECYSQSGGKSLIKVDTAAEGSVVDGFLLDGGEWNVYKPKADGEPYLTGVLKYGPGCQCPDGPDLVYSSARDFTLRNSILMNATFGGATVWSSHRDLPEDLKKSLGKAESAEVKVETLPAANRPPHNVVFNNIFLNNRGWGLVARGDGGGCPKFFKKATQVEVIDACPAVDVGQNSFLVTWAFHSDPGSSQGYGLDAQSGAHIKVHNNLFAGNIGVGVNHQRFNKRVWVDNNAFFWNRKADLWWNPKSNEDAKVRAKDFEDEVDVASENKTDEENGHRLRSLTGNIGEPIKLAFDPPFMAGVLNLSYSEQTSFDPSSADNVARELLGQNKQGTMKSSVSMFGNKYPWQEAAKLVSSRPGFGAQPFKPEFSQPY